MELPFTLSVAKLVGRRRSALRAVVAPVPRLMLCCALLALSGAGCEQTGAPRSVSVAADSAAGDIPFRLVGPGGAALVVAVMVNGEGPFDLILDTGATLTCLDEALARQLALPERRGMVGAGVGVGGAGRVRLHQADSLQIGPATAREILVCSLDLSAIQTLGTGARGLVGLNFLRQFHVELDFAKGILRLTSP
jgi:hypothetical protein